jgi:transcriptional antiterminator NusG
MTTKTKEVTRKKSQTMTWYAVRTQNNKERSVLEKLSNEIKFSNMESKLGRSIIPTEKVLSVKNGKKIVKEKIVYPGYIFIETDSTGEIINLLKNINGAAGFVRTRSGEIVAMKESEVKNILVEQEITNTKDFSNIYIMNEEVEIIDGAFSSFKGFISKLDVEKERVQVQVSIFGRPTNVDLTLMQIKKLQ